MNSLVLLTVFIFCFTSAFAQCPSFNAGTDQRFSSLYGSVAAGTSITIPAGQTVWFDTVSPVLNRIDISGSLIFDPSAANLKLSAQNIVVQNGGLLRIGCESAPFTRTAEIVLYGSNPADSAANPGSKMIFVASGGRMELWGDEGLTWTQLSETAGLTWEYSYKTNTYVPVGTSSINVADTPAGWKVGDKIVVASTDYDGVGQNEVRGIAAISGKTLTLDAPLTYMHYGNIWRGNGNDYVDMRAEVGHLTRWIKISGDISDGVSDNLGYGGHTIYYPNSTVHISGVEFYRMGQQGVLARYPVHWHMAKDTVVGSFIKKCSIHDTYQRAITIHFTNSILMSDNVAYNISGHAYFLENACESNNTYIHNLGVGIIPIPVNKLLVGADLTPSVFWITFPTNTWINNSAVGGAFGYWFSLPTHPTGPAASILNLNLYWPMYAPTGVFSGNTAHGSSDSGLFIDKASQVADGNDRNIADSSYYPKSFTLDPATHGTWPIGTVQQLISNSPSLPAQIINFTAYKCSVNGAWGRGAGMQLTGAMLADNQIGASFPGDSNLVEDSVFVGDTDNVGNPWAYSQASSFQGRTRFQTYNPAADIVGYRHYDCCGPDFLSGSRFYNFQNFTFQYTGQIRPAGAISVQPGPNVNPGRARQTNLSFFNTSNRFWTYRPPSYYGGVADPSTTWTATHDTDGFITTDADPVNGGCGAWIVANNPILLTKDCTYQPGWNSWICKAGTSPARRYFTATDSSNSNIVVQTANGKMTVAGFYSVAGTITRLYDGVKSYLPPGMSNGNSYPRSYQMNLVVNQEYLLQFGNGSTPRKIQLYGYDLAAGNAYQPGNEFITVAIPYPAGTTFTVGGGWSGSSTMVQATSKAALNSTSWYFDSAAELLWLYFANQVDSHRWDYGFATRTNIDIVFVTATCPNNVCAGSGYTSSVLSGYSAPAPAAPFISDCSVNGNIYSNGVPSFTVADASVTQYVYNDGLNPLQWVSWSTNWSPANTLTGLAAAVIPAGVTGNPIVAKLGPYSGFGFGNYWNYPSFPLTTQTHFVLTARSADGFGPSDLTISWTDKNNKAGPSVALGNPFYLTSQGPVSEGAWWTVAIPLADLGLGAGQKPGSIYIGHNQNRNVTVLLNSLYFANLEVTWSDVPVAPTTSTSGSGTPPSSVAPPVFNPKTTGGSFEKFSTAKATSPTNGTVSGNKSGLVTLGAGGVAGLAVGGVVLIVIIVVLTVALVFTKKSAPKRVATTVSTESLLHDSKSDITL